VDEPEPQCTGEGELDMVVTPSFFDYPALEDGARVPVYIPLQGGVFTELDIELTGLTKDDLSTLTFTVRQDGGDVLASPAPAMSFPISCHEDGSLFLDTMPLAFRDEWTQTNIMDLDEVAATMVIQLQLKGGMPPLTREYDVILDYRSRN
jgi:hypothetical protein